MVKFKIMWNVGNYLGWSHLNATTVFVKFHISESVYTRRNVNRCDFISISQLHLRIPTNTFDEDDNATILNYKSPRVSWPHGNYILRYIIAHGTCVKIYRSNWPLGSCQHRLHMFKGTSIYDEWRTVFWRTLCQLLRCAAPARPHCVGVNFLCTRNFMLRCSVIQWNWTVYDLYIGWAIWSIQSCNFASHFMTLVQAVFVYSRYKSKKWSIQYLTI